MTKRINWFIPPVVLIAIIVIINVVYNLRNRGTTKEPSVQEEVFETPSLGVEGEQDTQDIEMGYESAPTEQWALLDSKEVPKKPFAIQVASLREEDKAELLVEALKKKDYSAYIVTKDLGKKGIWYRVWVGEFETTNQAAETLDELKKDYKDSFIIVR